MKEITLKDYLQRLQVIQNSFLDMKKVVEELKAGYILPRQIKQ